MAADIAQPRGGGGVRSADSAPYYADSWQHLLAELELVDLLIQARVRRARQLNRAEDGFEGLCISEQEVDELLARPAGLPRWAWEEDPELREIAPVLERLRAQITQRAEESARRGISLRLAQLAATFDLTRFDVDVLLAGLAPELDVRYDRLYGYLQDDITKRRPSVDLVLNLLCRSLPEKLALRRRFGAGAPLLQHLLIQLFEDPSQPQPTLLTRYLRIDERVAGFLLGSDEPDARLAGFARCVDSCLGPEQLVLPERDRATVSRLARQAKTAAMVSYLHGPYGVGKQAAAAAIAAEAGRQLLVVDGARVAASEAGTAENLLRLTVREAHLSRASVYWDGFGVLLVEERRHLRNLLLEELERRGELAFLAGDAPWEPVDELRRLPFVRIELQCPGFSERSRLWSSALAGIGTPAADIAALANKFRFTAGQIQDAAATARHLAYRRAPGKPVVELSDLHEAARLHSNPKLATLARKIKPHYGWRDIILPRDRIQQLREICNCVKYRSTVYEEWGFERKLSLGKGLNVLFAGPPGTGKTMAAEIVAHELALDLYKIDLSTVVSKYIGETEKNLSKIFTEAESSNAILFFDEADALFGKRSEVRDSHDRYANIEIGYLLQRMEEYEGVVILATNFRKNMDEAFVRRLHFAVDFPFPNHQERRRIWEGVWPDATPRTADVNLDLVARRFEITGGSIRNIAVGAAFLAAGDGGAVSMRHLLQATRREYQKMGKVVTESEFGSLAGRDPGEVHDV